MESAVKNENYIHISGWMVKELDLKGNELLIYAIIYGFSQKEGQVYSGGLQYLADWTGSTKQGVIKVLKSLLESGLIIRTEKTINNVRFVEYYATKFNGVLNNVCGGIKQSLPNNIIEKNKIENKDKYIPQIEEILDYLNKQTGANFRKSTKSYHRLITARLSEGYTVADFRRVIDNKVAEWKGDGKMQAYLRPETLFGTKFESYLQQRKVLDKSAYVGGTEIERREYSDEDLSKLFSKIDEE